MEIMEKAGGGTTPRRVVLSNKRREILAYMVDYIGEKGYPPSIREICHKVRLASPSTVHTHLNVLEKHGLIVRDPAKPRAIVIRYDPDSGAVLASRPVKNVPLVGDVAAGTGVLAQENIEELLPLPEDFTGTGQMFMLRVRGDSMVEAGILDGDFVVARLQEGADDGDIVVAGIPDDTGAGAEGTVKTLKRRRGRVVLEPANDAYEPIELDPDDAVIYGKVVTVIRKM